MQVMKCFRCIVVTKFNSDIYKIRKLSKQLNIKSPDSVTLYLFVLTILIINTHSNIYILCPQIILGIMNLDVDI